MRKPADPGLMARQHAPESPIHERPYPVTGEDVEALLGAPIDDAHKRRVLSEWRQRLETRLRQPDDEARDAPDVGDVLGRVVDAFTRMGERD